MRRKLAERGLAGPAGPPAGAPRPRWEGPAPLSAPQRRMWLLQQLEPHSTAYNIAVGARLTGRLPVDGLERSLRLVVERHEILRSVYSVADDGEPRQTAVPADRLRIAVTDLRGRPARTREDAVDEAASRLAARPFDLTADLPLRLELLRLTDEEHVLLLVVHHIAWDDASWGVLLNDLTAAYAGRDLPPLEARYADLAVREQQRPRWTGADVEHWRRALADPPAPIPLATDHPRTADRGERGGRLARVLPADLRARLQRLARAEGATPFMALLAGFGALLHRVGGTDDLTIGSPVVHRLEPGAAALVGNFGNTLVLRSRTTPDSTFRTLLRETRTTCLGAYAHQQVPFDTLVQRLRPERAPGHHVLFDVMFSVRSDVWEGFDLPGIEVSERPVDHHAAAFDLAVAAVLRQDGGIGLDVTYRADLYAHATIAGLFTRFETFLRAAAEQPDAPLASLDVLGPGERGLLLDTWGSDRRALGEATVADLFREQVRRTPGAEALVWEEPAAGPGSGAVRHALRYDELDRRSDRIASALMARGLGPEQVVAVALPRSGAFLTAVLGVLKTGAAYLPVDPDYPPDRIALLLEDARPAVVLADSTTLGRLPPGAAVVLLGGPEDTPPGAVVPERCPARPAGAAYLIFTSGSTGRPKGVVVTHEGIPGLVSTMTGELGVGPGHRVLQFASMSFDTSVWEWTMALLTGAALVVVPSDKRLGPPLADFCVRHGITHLTLPPGVLAGLPDEHALPAGTTLVVAGEACPPELVRRWSATTRMFNSYGPTETTVDATLWACDPARTTPTVPIGRPAHNTSVRLLDAHLRPV
ncbi:non-ribosomal peptide synthetase, partial [Kitasatospora sp. NPDC001574]